MNEFTEVTAENLRLIRGGKGLNQEEVGELLGIPRNAVSKIEGGVRTLSDSEKHLLDWYFFGKLPPRLSNPLDLKGCLEFTDGEWNLVTRMALRDGLTPGKFIADKIRTYLAYNRPEEANPVSYPSLSKVAEDPVEYKIKGIQGN